MGSDMGIGVGVGIILMAVILTPIAGCQESKLKKEIAAERESAIQQVEAQRQQAIEAGAGRWTIDAKTGEREFKWGV